MAAAAWIAAACLTPAGIGLAQDKDGGRMPAAEAKKLKSPVQFTRKSIVAGKNVFLRNCVGCHGNDGKSMVDVVSDATDLTQPKFYKSGSTEGEVYRSIRDGAAETMPAFKTQISDDKDIWHLVNFIRSLWPDGARPPLQEDK
jgi:mono/diheme cytochrome c family protein